MLLPLLTVTNSVASSRGSGGGVTPSWASVSHRVSVSFQEARRALQSGVRGGRSAVLRSRVLSRSGPALSRRQFLCPSNAAAELGSMGSLRRPAVGRRSTRRLRPQGGAKEQRGFGSARWRSGLRVPVPASRSQPCPADMAAPGPEWEGGNGPRRTLVLGQVTVRTPKLRGRFFPLSPPRPGPRT